MAAVSPERNGREESGEDRPDGNPSAPPPTALTPPTRFAESVSRPVTLRIPAMETEARTLPPPPKPVKLRSGPSSRSTVLTIAGLMIVGFTMIATGIIVLCTERRYVEFQIAGSCFLVLGCVFLVVCLILQRKNVRKYMEGLNDDLDFLHLDNSPLWRCLFAPSTPAYKATPRPSF